ncbi:hypothetical protein [Streptomyces sp. SID5785]|uniref:hypothetical protein n=1 Tax=Streptomyces sp. SID5785 TaxID=2690309 RepID=UPI00192668C3|nr:hypothetical protein [Streptomyces sp. SID5785]
MPTGRLPASYALWLGGLLASLTGNAVFAFALGWAATAHGGGVAGLASAPLRRDRTGLVAVAG